MDSVILVGHVRNSRAEDKTIRGAEGRAGTLPGKQQSLTARDIPEADLKGYSSGSYKRLQPVTAAPHHPRPSPPPTEYGSVTSSVNIV